MSKVSLILVQVRPNETFTHVIKSGLVMKSNAWSIYNDTAELSTKSLTLCLLIHDK